MPGIDACGLVENGRNSRLERSGQRIPNDRQRRNVTQRLSAGGASASSPATMIVVIGEDVGAPRGQPNSLLAAAP